MARFRVSYTFTDEFVGDADVIRKALRDLSFATAFNPLDITEWTVVRNAHVHLGRVEGESFVLTAKRTLVDEIFEGSERAALRKFLYGMDLPDSLDVAGITIERLPGPVVEAA